jgi:hypothetical protein
MFLSSIPLGLFSSHAATVWSDDFEDGNYDDWIVQWGDWVATNNTLQALYTPNTYSNGGMISHPSSTAYGTWGFDFYITPNDRAINFIFILNNLTLKTVSGRLGWDEGYLYQLKIVTFGENRIFLNKLLGAYPERDSPVATYYADGDIVDLWHHIDITRDTDGRFRIYLDRVLIIDVVDTSITSSEYFNILSFPYGPQIDNIIVSDTIDILPSAISCMVSTGSISIGDSVTISGAIQTVSGAIQPPSGVPVTLSYQMDGSWSPLATVTSAGDGSYSNTWTPTMTGTLWRRHKH